MASKSWQNSLTPESYERMLREFRSNGYSFVKFSAVKPTRNVVLRHDIDFSISAAVSLARLEYSLEVSSSYFVQLRSPIYNVLSPIACQQLKEIHSFGHEIALHVDLSLYDGQLTEEVEREQNVLLKFLPFLNCRIISIHRPAKVIPKIETLYLSDKISHTYERRYTKDIHYFSDSTGRWRYGHPINSANLSEKSSMQVLTHPIWWIVPGTDRSEKLHNFISNSRHLTVKDIESTAISFRVYGAKDSPA